MILDSEAQRTMILQMITAATIPGSAVTEVAALKAAVEKAKIEED